MASRVTGGRAARAFVARAKAAQRAAPDQVAVGFFPDQEYPDGQKVAQVAIVAEFGAGDQPEAPFFRQAIATSKRTVGAMTQAALRGSRGRMALTDAEALAAGRAVADQVSDSIKAHDLVDTGQLQRSPDARIE